MPVYKGWMARIYKDSTQIGFASGVSVDISGNMEPFFEIDSRAAVDVVEGNREISGTIDRAWIDPTMLNLITGNLALTPFTLYLYAQGASSTNSNPSVVLLGCKADSETVDLPQDGFEMNSVDFMARDFLIA